MTKERKDFTLVDIQSEITNCLKIAKIFAEFFYLNRRATRYPKIFDGFLFILSVCVIQSTIVLLSF